MSQSAMQEITCPKCGKKTSFLVWDSINTMEDPEMKEKVRNDEAFRFHCPECGASALFNYNFLYHQQEDKVLIYVSADGEDASEMAQILDQRGNAFDGYRKRIVRSYRIVEIIKSSVWDNVEAHYKDKKIDEIYFATNDDGVHGFLFRRAGEMVASMEFDESLYKAIYDSAYERLDAATRNDLYIDRDWAKDVVERMG